MRPYLLTALLAATAAGTASAQEAVYTPGATPAVSTGLIYQGMLLDHRAKSQESPHYDGEALLSAVSARADAILSRSLEQEKGREETPGKDVLVTAR